MITQKCKQCQKDLPKTTEYFSKYSSINNTIEPGLNYHSICKQCEYIMDQSSGGQFVHGTLTNVAIDRHTTETIIFNKPYNLKDSSTFIELPFSIDIN